MLARHLGSARHIVLAGAGHLAPPERPATFREFLLDLSRRQSIIAGGNEQGRFQTGA
jgi:pimeloyl-ACP methyl ester carboxylesterase